MGKKTCSPTDVKLTNAELGARLCALHEKLDALEHERQLAAFEIHDTFLQDVISALMYIDAYCESRQVAVDERPEQLDVASQLLRGAIDKARGMIGNLKAPVVGEEGLVCAINSLVTQLGQRGIEVQFTAELGDEPPAGQLEAAVFRIVQEGLRNIERHSQAKRAEIRLSREGDLLRLEIRDCGVGFDPAKVGESHFGLQGIRHRAQLIGGEVQICTAPGKGTQLLVTFPPAPPADANRPQL